MNERQLMQKICQISFAMDDTRLYLDTHPDCTKALEYFNELAALRKAAICEYSSKYGPIGQYDSESDWDWNEPVYPWQLGGVACRTPK